MRFSAARCAGGMGKPAVGELFVFRETLGIFLYANHGVGNIYLHDWVIFRANVGKYSSTMEHMGTKTVLKQGLVNDLNDLNVPTFEDLFHITKPNICWR